MEANPDIPSASTAESADRGAKDPVPIQVPTSEATPAQDSGTGTKVDVDTKFVVFSAVRTGDLSGVGTFIAAGGDVNMQDSSRRTPLHLAAWKGNSEMVQLLLRAKASTSIKGKPSSSTTAKKSHLPPLCYLQRWMASLLSILPTMLLVPSCY
jgi:hypothetical protein